MNLSFIGAGYPLYFHFLQNAILLMAIMLLISGEFNIISNYISENCISLTETQATDESDDNNEFCVLDWVTKFSLVNKTNTRGLNTIQHYLNFLCLIGVIGFMLYYRKTQKELYRQIDLKETTPSDYAISVKNLPNDLPNIESTLLEYFSTIDNKHYEIKNINLCYDLTERGKLHQSFRDLLNKKKQLLKKKVANESKSISLDSINEEITIINREILFKEQEMRNYDINLPHNHLKFCGIAIITFNTQKEKKEIMEKSRLTPIDRIKIFSKKDLALPRGFIFQGHRLIIERAPEPNEILFNNLHSNSREKIKIRLVTFFLTMLELGAFGIIIYYLLSFQYDYFTIEINNLQAAMTQSLSDELLSSYQEMMIMLYLSSGCISLFIVVINNIFIEYITKIIVKMEKYSTYTRKKITLATRLSLVTLLMQSFFCFG